MEKMEKEGLDVAKSIEGSSHLGGAPESSEPSVAGILEALQHILDSPFFRSSARGKQFLSYVVRYTIENPHEPLKERTIGVALFNRSVDYATGDDSVVRAQAREVRRRLENYYNAHRNDSLIRIELPVGSYSPTFEWAIPRRGDAGTSSGSGSMEIASPTVLPSPAFLAAIPSKNSRADGSRGKLFFWVGLFVFCIVGLLVAVKLRRTSPPDSTIKQFWAPAFASSKPLLICLPKPIMYRPTADLYKRTAQTAGEFDHEVDRMTHRPHLRPDDTLRWSEMIEYYEYGVSQGDVQAAVRLSNFVGKQNKDSEIRIGDGLSTADLRNSPAIVIGAFSNPRTMEMMSAMHFAFVDDDKGIRIQEQGASGRSWYTKHGSIGEDYGLVTRLLDSGTGQFVVLVAGIEASGSDAAADLVVDSNKLEAALHGTSRDWSRKNVQILVQTEVRDGVAGPAQVVAVYAW